MPVRDVRFDILADDRTRAAFASVRRNLGDTRRDVASMSAAFRQTSSGAAVIARSLGAGLGIGIATSGLLQLPGMIRSAVSDLDELGDAAQRAGISGEKLQVIRFALEQNAGSAEEADSAMQRFAKTIGEAASDKAGAAAKNFKAIGVNVRDAAGAVRPASDVFEDILRVFPRIGSESQATALAVRLFGRDAGPALAITLRQGVAGMEEAEQKIRDINGLISNDTLKKADELDKKFRQLGTTISVAFKSAAVNVAEAVAAIIGEMNRLAASIPKAIDPKAAGAAAGELIGNKPGVRIRNAFAAADGVRDDLALKSALIQKSLGSISPDLGDDDETAARAAKKQADALESVIEQLKFEGDQLNRNALQQQIYNELKRAGVAIDTEAGQQIASLVTRNEALRSSQEATAEQTKRITEGFKNMGARAGDALGRIIFDGGKAKDVIKQLLIDLARTQLSRSISGLFGSIGSGLTGGGSGIVGSLLGRFFGGSRDTGGSVSPGKVYAIGKGSYQEAFVPSVPGMVYRGGNGSRATETSQVEHRIKVEPSPFFITTVEQRSQKVAAGVMANAQDERRRYGTP